jgi:hypothetical protein
MLLGIDRNRLALRPHPARAFVGGGAEDPTGVGPAAQGANFSVSSATCFIQSGKGSVFSRVVDLDPIILFRPGRFGINDFTFVAETA